MIWIWAGFILFILGILALDLGVFNRRPHAPSMRQALGFTAMTAALAVAFAGFIWFGYDHHLLGLGTVVDGVDHRTNDGRLAAVKFITGYVVEMSLSMDNVFVFALTLEHLKVPVALQHRVLFWGILGALIMRGAAIGAGAALVLRYEWVLYLFGVFLIYTAIKMLMAKELAESDEEAAIVRWLNKHFRVTKEFHGTKFLIRRDGRQWITPLMVALIAVDVIDLVFAVDSIPAIFSITTDAFLVFTSNVFAILCLRSLYFGLVALIERFKYLKVSLAVILGIVGVKMLTSDWLHDRIGDSVNLWMLGLVIGILLAGAAASALVDKQATNAT